MQLATCRYGSRNDVSSVKLTRTCARLNGRQSGRYMPSRRAACAAAGIQGGYRARPTLSRRRTHFPNCLIHNADALRGRPAIRHKDLGIWQTWTWDQMLDEVRAFSGRSSEARPQARRQGRHRGARTGRGSTGRSARRRRWARFRCRSIRTRSPTKWLSCWSMPKSRSRSVEDQEQVDKIISIADRLNHLSHIVYDEPRGLRDYDHARLKSLADVASAWPRETCARPG